MYIKIIISRVSHCVIVKINVVVEVIVFVAQEHAFISESIDTVDVHSFTHKQFKVKTDVVTCACAIIFT